MHFLACLGLALYSWPMDVHERSVVLPKSLAAVVEDVSKRLGQPLAVSANLADRIVLARDTESLGNRMLPILAEAVCGRWVEVDGAKRLELDSNEAKEREKKLKSAIRSGLEKALSDLLPISTTQSELAEAEAILRAIEALPAKASAQNNAEELAFWQGYYSAGGLARRLMKSLGPDALLKLRDGEVSVYCSEPILGELPLGQSSLKEIERHKAVQLSLVGLLTSHSPPPKLQSVWEAIRQSATSSDGDLQVLFSVGRNGLRFGGRCDVFSNRKRVDTGFCTVQPALPAVALSLKPKDISIEPLSRLAKTLFESGNRNQLLPQAVEEREARRIVDVAEPLAFCVPELIDGLTSGPIVAVLTDDMLAPAFQTSESLQPDVRAFARALQDRGIEIHVDEECTIVRPIAPSMTADQKSLRTAIRQHLLKHQGSRAIPAHDTLQYYGKTWTTAPSAPLLIRFYPNVLQALGWHLMVPGRIHPAGYRFLGSLNLLQINALMKGELLELDLLSPGQINLARHWAMEDTYGGSEFELSGVHRINNGGTWSLSAPQQQEQYLAARSSGPHSSWFPDSARTLTEWKERLDNWSKSAGQPSETLASEAEWAVIPTDSIHFRLSSPKNVGLSGEFKWTGGTKPRFVTWANLEEAIRNTIAGR